MKKISELYRYKREYGRWSRTANLSVNDKAKLIIHPIEPLYMPDAVTEFLEIKFDEVMVEPNGKTEVFLNFPIEFGVFVESNGKTEVLDVFTLKYPKYSLYGSPSRGVITRWYQSKTYTSPPFSRNFKEGIMRLSIENRSGDWTTISRVVVYERGMNLYFDSHVVSMDVDVVVTLNGIAEVTAVDRPLHEGMTRSYKMYKPRKSTNFSNISGAVVDTMFTMDSGLK